MPIPHESVPPECAATEEKSVSLGFIDGTLAVVLVPLAIIARVIATYLSGTPLSELAGDSNDFQAFFVTPWYHGTAWMLTSQMAFSGRNSHETRPLD